MESNSIPKALRRLLILFGVFLVLSLLVSGFSAVYVAMGAPLRSPYVPSTVGFEGQLADANGNPVVNGNYTITFSLYSQASGGSSLWTETQTVAVADGLYSVQLGTINALEASDFDGARWLGVQVSGDSEMTPRIPISAVPFALNARQAMGLQGRDVASTAPTDGQVLTWDTTNSEWYPDAPGARTFPEINPVGSNASPQDFFGGYRTGAILRYVDYQTVEVGPGEVMVNGYMRRNTAAVNVGFSGLPDGPNRGLDSGVAQPNTTYYIYAVADDAESTFDLIVSASSSAPTGPANFRQLGWFKTNQSASPIQIMVGSAANIVQQPTFAPGARVYNTANISLAYITPTALTFDSERWDNDGIHSTATNPGRLTCKTAGKYLIIGHTRHAPVQNQVNEFRLSIRLNGTTLVASSHEYPWSYSSYLGGTFEMTVAAIYDLAVNDYVELVATQMNGGGISANVVANGNDSPEFEMIWLGP